MSFSEREKTIALAIVKIFETSKPFGNYSAVAVLDDGAGISYGTSQFTHGSGSLALVLSRFIRLGGPLPAVVSEALPSLRSRVNIKTWAANRALKSALADLGADKRMQQAQREIAFENYLKPALDACEGSDFQFPLSLAVIYDSINQGGYARVRDRVKFQGPSNGSIKPEEFEREWITEYCQKRVAYLKGLKSSAAKASVYRPNFFLGEIKRGNWSLALPITVHGHRLTEAILFPKSSATGPTTGGTNPPAATTATGESPLNNPQAPTDGPGPNDIKPQDPPSSLVPITTGVVEVELVKAAPTEPPPADESTLTKIGNKANAAYTMFASMGAGVVAWFSGASEYIILGVVVVVITLGGLYMILNWRRSENAEKRANQAKLELERIAAEERQKREDRAHEIQLKLMESASCPTQQTIRLVPPPPAATELPNSEGT